MYLTDLSPLKVKVTFLTLIVLEMEAVGLLYLSPPCVSAPFCEYFCISNIVTPTWTVLEIPRFFNMNQWTNVFDD